MSPATSASSSMSTHTNVARGRACATRSYAARNCVQVSHQAAHSATTTSRAGSANARPIASRSLTVRTGIAASGNIERRLSPALQSRVLHDERSRDPVVEELAIGIDDRPAKTEHDECGGVASVTARVNHGVGDEREPGPDPAGDVTSERAGARRGDAAAVEKAQPPRL